MSYFWEEVGGGGLGLGSLGLVPIQLNVMILYTSVRGDALPIRFVMLTNSVCDDALPIKFVMSPLAIQL